MLNSKAGIASKIRLLRFGGIVVLGSIPHAALIHWPKRFTYETVLTAERYSHIIESHPDRKAIVRFEECIVETIRMPELVYRDQQSGNVANLLSALDAKYDLFVSVVLSNNAERANSVLSARKQPARLRYRDMERGLVVWKKEE